MNVNLISEKRSGFTGTRDRAKLHRLSTNLRKQGSSEIEIQSHLRDWLKKRGKMHYHGTPYKFEGPPDNTHSRWRDRVTITESDIKKIDDCLEGECLRNAIRTADANKDLGARVIQGEIYMPRYGEKKMHSWVEIGDMVYDPTIDLLKPKSDFYKAFDATVTNDLASEEATLLAVRLNFSAPHRAYSVYTPDEIATVREILADAPKAEAPKAKGSRLSNAVHVGTRRSAQDRLKTKDLTGRYNPRSLQPISPRIIPLTVNVGKDSHALGSRASSFSDSNASNFGLTTRLTPGSPPIPLELTHTRQHGTPMNNTSYTKMRPRDDQNTVVYRNAVEDKGNISYSTRKPEETLRTLHNLANQNEAYTRKLSNKAKSLLKKLRKVRASSKFSKEIGKYALDAAAAKKTGTEKHPWSAIEAHGLRTKEDNRAATNAKGAEELADNSSELSRIKRMIRHAKGH